jgi:hypothetical protein
MENLNETAIDPEILPYLNEIAERLQTGHASVMVGAGFSRNADFDGDVKSIPIWKDLSTSFFFKLYGKEHTDADREYNNIPKLTEYVEAKFERSILEELIIKAIPDEQLQPSILHEKLLTLPWVDVFTTNYDTLLERANNSVLGKNYRIINNIG